ncbi:helix-turn-helix domain-containing protein [Haloactinomyces albus]|uniref:helix-turn-helix domain-containing protein n=1 Tax=Haloactinomyces albus TaxID=1352928 RepID=UPI00286BDF66|nr:helix-turn-helix domain-containing protein [Haloactinomyces albus]
MARRADVPIGTVSNALDRPDRVSADTRARIRSVIDELGYVRSESVQASCLGRELRSTLKQQQKRVNTLPAVTARSRTQRTPCSVFSGIDGIPAP